LDHLFKPAVTPIEDTIPPEITVNSANYSLTIGDNISLSCTATDNVEGTVPCTYFGAVDTSTVGTYDITYEASDSSGNTATVIKTYTVEGQDYLTMDLTPYYDNAEGLSGTALQNALNTIISDYTPTSYGESRYILNETDADPNISGNLILVYTQNSVDGTWDQGDTWNREHVWPQSLLDVDTNNSSTHEGADLHNLKPCDSSENSSRSNKYYDNITTSDTYAPPEEVRGDIARILFYMMVRYPNLELVNTSPNTHEMGLLDRLIEWHHEDPVDVFEEHRNDVIYNHQDNRNPFIDYEHFTELIFSDHTYYN
jgi:endonuclease I